MAKETVNSINWHSEGVYEVCSLGFAVIAIVLVGTGFSECKLWYELLQMSSVVKNPDAVAFANEIMARGLFGMGLGVYAASGSVAAGIRRLRM